MHKLHVVCGNDFPEAIFATREAAEAFIAEQPTKSEMSGVRIYWHRHELPVYGLKKVFKALRQANKRLCQKKKFREGDDGLKRLLDSVIKLDREMRYET